MLNRLTHRPADAAAAQAARWLARLHADDRGAADEAAFRLWLAQGPSHAVAFAQVTAAWEAAGAVGSDLRPAPTPQLDRRVVLAAAAGAVGLAAPLLMWRSAQAGVYETDVGEQRRLALQDGTRVLLDTDSRIRVRFDPQLRAVDLLQGRANFRVAADPGRPFVVSAADYRVLAEADDVDVRLDGKAVSVLALEGRPRVRVDDRAVQAISAGQALSLRPGVVARRTAPGLAEATAWQSGRALFDGDETLAEAAREMNRYSRLKLVVQDPALANLKVSGVYRTGDNLAFARAVALLLPLRVQSEPGRIRLEPAG